MGRPNLHDIVWKLADQEALQRGIALACARYPEPQRAASMLLALFWEEVQAHPQEWPSSNRPPSDHVWRFGRVVVHYRLHPDAQSVEIISVAGADS